MPRMARVATWAYFFLSGAGMAVWVARIPSVKHQLALTDGMLAIGLMAVAAGALLAMQVVGRLVDRLGSAPVTHVSGVLVSVALVGPGLAPNLPVLVVTLFVLGCAMGLVDVAMNAQAVLVERAYGRPIMTSFHAGWSLGGLAGATAGGGAAGIGLAPAPTFAIAGGTLALVALVAGRRLLPGRVSHEPAVEAEPGRRGFGISWAVLFMGVLGMFCYTCEGSAADWSAVYMRDGLGTSIALAPAAFAAFSITMTTGRLVGDWLATRFGAVRLVTGCGLLAAGGLGGALLAGQPIAAVAGFGIMGAGLSCIVPQLFTAAGNRRPGRSGRDLALVASVSYFGMLAGPVVIGGAANLVGLPRALTIPVILSVFVALSARALRPAPIA
jgi:MFS family permease